jgi:hypothetical protein
VVQSEPLGAQMTRFLAAIVFTICVAAPSVRADSFSQCGNNCPSFAYDVSATMTVATHTNEEFVWTFQKEGPNPSPAFSYDVAYQTDPSIISPGVTGSFFLTTETTTGKPDGIVPEHTLGLLFGPGLRRRDCLPNCSLMGHLQSEDILFTDVNFKPGNPPDASFTWDFSDESLTSAEAPQSDPPPTATPEPSDLLLFGTGIIGLGFVRKFTSLRK